VAQLVELHIRCRQRGEAHGVFAVGRLNQSLVEAQRAPLQRLR
jgi:hypothetical protein